VSFSNAFRFEFKTLEAARLPSLSLLHTRCHELPFCHMVHAMSGLRAAVSGAIIPCWIFQDARPP